VQVSHCGSHVGEHVIGTHAFIAGLHTLLPVHLVMHRPPQFSCAIVHPQLPPEQVPFSGLLQSPPRATHPLTVQVSHCGSHIGEHVIGTQAFMAGLHTLLPVHLVMQRPPQFSCAIVQLQLPPEQVPFSGLLQPPPWATHPLAVQLSHCGSHIGEQVIGTHAFMAGLHTLPVVHFAMQRPPQFSCAAVQPQLPPEQVPLSGFVQEPALSPHIPVIVLHWRHSPSQSEHIIVGGPHILFAPATLQTFPAAQHIPSQHLWFRPQPELSSALVA
jgi:hypothetical protein